MPSDNHSSGSRFDGHKRRGDITLNHCLDLEIFGKKIKHRPTPEVRVERDMLDPSCLYQLDHKVTTRFCPHDVQLQGLITIKQS
ncbi:hypothetical protein RRG08_028193 [Elysia crispata]|uniref:Uncharacterized protein n=1 Tax=Elysia crispata TaxID=231223 RepID=A0AAE1B826_9GAST|nr:hypothetical protein RRG08_028193 [Elysia crispata]